MVTNIPYVDEVWNVVVGCTKCSPGCDNCWAEKLHDMRHTAYWTAARLPEQYAKSFSEIQLISERLKIPLHWRKPRKILTCSMGDLFHPKVTWGFIEKVMATIEECPQHEFMLLTKRPQNMAEYFNSLGKRFELSCCPNAHLGVTICNQKEADEKIPILLSIPGKIWLSIEPLLEPIDYLTSWLVGCDDRHLRPRPIEDRLAKRDKNLRSFEFVVIGCESGPKRRPIERKHIKDLYDQCKAAGVDVMVKQMAENKDGMGKVIHDLEWIKKELGD